MQVNVGRKLGGISWVMQRHLHFSLIDDFFQLLTGINALARSQESTELAALTLQVKYSNVVGA